MNRMGNCPPSRSVKQKALRKIKDMSCAIDNNDGDSRHADTSVSDASSTLSAAELATQWWRNLEAAALHSATIVDAPGTVTNANNINDTSAPDVTEALSSLISHALDAGKSLLLLVPDDEFLPAFSSTLDMSLRPLCLVLPSADFAARIAMRATLSLLRSRLTRDSDDEQGVAWQAQRRRIDKNAELWREAQNWNASNSRSDWPQACPQLFSVRILPIAAFRGQPQQAADITVCFCCDLGADAAQLGGKQLYVGGRAESGHHYALAFVDETTRLSVELAQLTQDVGELELELATAQAEMSDFTRRYYSQVGRRMTELDALKAKLAHRQLEALRHKGRRDSTHSGHSAPENEQAAEAAAAYESLHKQAERSKEESRRFAEAENESHLSADTKPFRPDANIKRLFRQLAQRIHPDRAANEHDRAWRTQLMSEANRAYRAGNAEALKEVAILWEEGSATTQDLARARSATPPQDLLRRQIATMRQRFEAIRAELHRLFGSRLYELFLAARQVRRAGRDLLQEMADRLDAQISDALARLNPDASPA